MSSLRKVLIASALTFPFLTYAALSPLPATAQPSALPAGCSGTAPILCHFDVAPGNYDVTVDLGSTTRAATTGMSVETRRQVLPAVSTRAGQVIRSTATVNVRIPEGQPTGQGGTGTAGLSITFDGSAPAIGALTVKPASAPLVAYLAGDSTVCDQPGAPYAGWGQLLPTRVRNGAVVANYGDSGESSGSFLANAALFPKMKPLIKSKDLVFIQFGHNDKDTTATAFRDNLTKLVNGVRERGGTPVLMTPPVRRLFSGNALTPTALHINGRGVDLPAVIRALGQSANVPVIDLTAKSKALVESLGPTASQQLFLTRENNDNTHFSVYGATQMAELVVQGIRERNLSLTTFLRPAAAAKAAQPSQTAQTETLDRGVISVHTAKGNRVSWRLLADDPQGVAYNVYRDGTKVNSTPVSGPTSFVDADGRAGAKYVVRAVADGVERQAKFAAEDSLTLDSVNGVNASSRDVPLQIPPGGTTPSGEAYTYTANDTSVGDLDGDGQYEIVVKWDPTNAHDNAHAGYTGNVYLDAYKLNGTRLWRIDLGRNIRAGAHYTQFQVFDYDGDGRAELAVKTADGTRSGTGQVIGNASADHRNSSGYILTGPEFLSVFRGTDGAVLATANYQPPRGTVSSWGDNYGNRVDRFLAGTAYLDGSRPSIIMARGYYTRSVISAWDFRNGALTQRWIFDSNSAGSQWTGKGNHNLSIADVDADGRDEVMYGSMAIDDNGRGLWQNNTHHGDSYHVSDFIPSRPGLEVFKPSEWTSEPSHWMGDARTGQIIWSAPSCGCDNGRGVAADVWAGNPGAEAWSSAVSGLRSGTNGSQVAARKPGSINFVVWWDGDAQRELLDGTNIDKYGTSSDTRLLTGSGVVSNNGTKSTPALSADILGDWREEVIWRTSDNRALRIYSTTDSTSITRPSLMQDRQYRVAVAWQNTGYNQPPHPSFAISNAPVVADAPALAGNGLPNDSNIQYYGRWNRSNTSWYWMGWAGGYVETAFTGSSIGVRQRNAIDLYYSIDGKPLQWRRNVSGNVTLATGLSSGTHKIRIGYRERAGSYTGDPVFGGFLLASGGGTTAISRPAKLVEFIGDSITVGQPNGNRPFTSYPWLTGEALKASHTQIAQGGACLVAQDCYGMVDWFRRSSNTATTDDWNFSTYQASAVVINLGTNDVGHGVSGPTFQQNYVVMLERVRRAYPSAQIFAMGTFRNRYLPETRNAVAARTSAGDTKVRFVDTTGWIDAATDTHDNVHPTDAGHVKIAQRLTAVLDDYI